MQNQAAHSLARTLVSCSVQWRWWWCLGCQPPRASSTEWLQTLWQLGQLNTVIEKRVTNNSKHSWGYFWLVNPETVSLAGLTNGETGLRATEIVQLIEVLEFSEGSPEHGPELHTTVTYVELSVALQNQQPPPWLLCTLFWSMLEEIFAWSRPVQTTCSTVRDEHGTFLLLVKEWGQGWLIWEMMIAETSSKLLSHRPTHLQEGHSWPQ